MPPSDSAASTARMTARARQSAAALPSLASTAGSGVAVERRVNRTDGTGETVLRHDRQAPAPALVECRVGGDDGDRRISAGDTGTTLREIFRVKRGFRDRRLRVDLAGKRQIGGPQAPAIR